MLVFGPSIACMLAMVNDAKIRKHGMMIFMGPLCEGKLIYILLYFYNSIIIIKSNFFITESRFLGCQDFTELISAFWMRYCGISGRIIKNKLSSRGKLIPFKEQR